MYARFLVLLAWNAETKSGRFLSAPELEGEPHLSAVDVKRIGPATLDEMSRLYGSTITPHLREQLAGRWEEFLGAVEAAAREYLADGSASGLLDNEWFPSRLNMTGEYYVREVNDGERDADLAFFVPIHFIGQRTAEDQTNFGYLGLTLNMDVVEGRIVCEHADSFVAWTHENDADDRRIIEYVLATR